MIDIILQIFAAAFAATTVMTMFSYAVSKSAREIYKEPVLLAYVLKSVQLKSATMVHFIMGWILHYLIGLGFVVAYHILWQHNIVAFNWIGAYLLGAISGVIGIIGWVILFSLQKQQPNIDFKGYYIQLFFAHVIFGATAFIVYKQFI
ncbi:hypothetical protein [Flavobacterium foetidum]|uniref:hypothetical protein n=1 Tax=Flavobacterium foetidum TaxID=2026681 RepID=UPI001074D6EE|nr:hypothetical protein [Flavobacterium foetidum]KAF2517148.1 hypothetical protein E0W73_03360 [Flavobacterium foetidum]